MFGISSKLFVVYVLLAGFVLQYSQKAFVLIDFIYNQEEIAQTKCENRFKTILVCKGSCVLAKKIIEVESNAPSCSQNGHSKSFFRRYISSIFQQQFVLWYPYKISTIPNG